MKKIKLALLATALITITLSSCKKEDAAPYNSTIECVELRAVIVTAIPCDATYGERTTGKWIEFCGTRSDINKAKKKIEQSNGCQNGIRVVITAEER